MYGPCGPILGVYRPLFLYHTIWFGFIIFNILRFISPFRFSCFFIFILFGFIPYQSNCYSLMCFTYAKITEKNIKEREANQEQKIPTRVVFLGTNKLILFVFLTLMLIFKLFDFWYNHAMIILRNERCMGHVAQFWECINLCFFTTPFDLDLLFLVYCVLFLHFDLVVYFFILSGFIPYQTNCC